MVENIRVSIADSTLTFLPQMLYDMISELKMLTHRKEADKTMVGSVAKKSWVSPDSCYWVHAHGHSRTHLCMLIRT